MKGISELIEAMVEYESGNPDRINHFMKVYAYAKTIGELENISPNMQYALEAAAVTHDIGIKSAMEKYGDGGGDMQQREGPPIAENMLSSLGFAPTLTKRISWLIAHHHTYDSIDGLDHQILIECDFLVNFCEGNIPFDAVVRDKLFKTKTGLFFFDQLFHGRKTDIP